MHPLLVESIVETVHEAFQCRDLPVPFGPGLPVPDQDSVNNKAAARKKEGTIYLFKTCLRWFSISLFSSRPSIGV